MGTFYSRCVCARFFFFLDRIFVRFSVGNCGSAPGREVPFSLRLHAVTRVSRREGFGIREGPGLARVLQRGVYLGSLAPRAADGSVSAASPHRRSI